MVSCPQCHKPLKRVRKSNWLNDNQYDAVKAGDWFCESCPDNGRGQSGFCYWWQREIEAFESERCTSITRI